MIILTPITPTTMPHFISLHSGNNKFWINVEHISAIFPTMLKRDQREVPGSKLILATHVTRFIVEETPDEILKLVSQMANKQSSKDCINHDAETISQNLGDDNGSC